ncbi:MAG: LysR family transcriptional regulator [Sneathiella sp.]|nr:LysR family transcriptional regulator [Sneathiella sp.]
MSDTSPTWLPSLNALRAFETVARHMSFQKAAEELNVTSAAVQQLVRGLESTLNTSLVIRDGRHLSLTKRGKIATSDLTESFEGLNRAVGKIRHFNDRQQLRISAEPSFATVWLADRLRGFQELYKDIDVLIESSNRLVDLRNQEADIAIRYRSTPDDEFQYHRLFEDETVAVCSPHRLQGKTLPLQSEDLLSIPLIHYEWPYSVSLQLVWREWIEKMGFDIDIVDKGLRFTDYTMAIQSAIAGIGIALVSRPLITKALDTGLLVEAFENGIVTKCGYDVVIAKGSEKKHGIREFTDWIVAEAKL